ncbi:MAG: DUF429 domain-containing protein [Chloroflexi bacterium]|nr:DUF429 domain-containing protein [Chloroflexota bacterium]
MSKRTLHERLIYGLDFTSAPTRQKPITCAGGSFDGEILRITTFEALTDFDQFEAVLMRFGPWTAGFDFPFGQPERLIRALGWGDSWGAYVRRIAGLGKEAFEAAIAAYRATRPPGDKHHLRRTDEWAGAKSPMMLHGVPVGKMFFQGAPRLLAAGVHVAPCHPTGDSRVAVEAYPALVARKWIGSTGYKSDARPKQTPDHRLARQSIVDGLRANREHYGFDVALTVSHVAELVDDPTGDQLDAVLCAVQAAWASTQPGYGIPDAANGLEGWIVDPAYMKGSDNA